MRLGVLMAAAGAFALAACSPAPEPAPEAEVAATSEADLDAALAADDEAGAPADAVISGAASWTGLDLPETARLIVDVTDVTRPADNLLMRQDIPITTGSPVAFTGTISKFDLIPGGNLVLTAKIQDGYAILLASDGQIDIADSGEISGLDVPLFNPEDIARGIPGKLITPQGTDYVCGGEPLNIALEAGAAYVTFSDGNAVKLDKLEGAEGSVTQFSNGRFLVEQASDGLRFGRGRAVPMPCTLKP